MEKIFKGIRSSLAIFAVIAATVAFFGCSSSSDHDDSSVRDYRATAGAGDFIKMQLDPTDKTYTYENLTTEYSETGTYTTSESGYLSFTAGDGRSCLRGAFEAPDLALVMIADNTGSSKDKTSIVFGLPKNTMTTSDVTDRGATDYNLIQFRTTDGGIEIGTASFANGVMTSTGYEPTKNGVIHGIPSDFGEQGVLQLSDDASYVIFNKEEDMGEGPVILKNYLFKTALEGVLAVDTPQGSMLVVEQQDTKDFQSAWAGTYHAVIYEGSGIESQVDTTGNVANATITVSADGALTVDILDADGNVSGTPVDGATLIPMADADVLRDGSDVYAMDNYGMFYYTDPSDDREVFCIFLDNVIFFGSGRVLTENEILDATGLSEVMSYDYFYGAALRR